MIERSQLQRTGSESQNISYEEVFEWVFTRFVYATGDLKSAASIADMIASKSQMLQAKMERRQANSRPGDTAAAQDQDAANSASTPKDEQDRFVIVDEIEAMLHLEIEQYLSDWRNLWEDGQQPIDSETILIQLISTLMHVARNSKSPYTAAAILMILGDYASREAADVYGLIDPAGIGEDGLRRRKKFLFDPLASNFSSFVQTENMGPNEGNRFIKQETTEHNTAVVTNLLNLLTSIRPTCCHIPPSFDPHELDLNQFIQSHLGSASAKEIERGRKHIMGHPECISAVLTALKLPEWLQKLWIMNVQIPPGGGGTSEPPIDRRPPPPRPPAEMVRMRKSRFAKSKAGRRAFGSGRRFSNVVKIAYGGKSRVLHLGNSEMSLSFRLNFGDNVIKVADVEATVDDNPRVLMPLDLHFISWDADEVGDGTRSFVTDLPTRAKLKFALNYQKDADGELSSADVQLSYEPTEAFDALAATQPGLRANFKKWVSASVRTMSFVAAFATGLYIGQRTRELFRRRSRELLVSFSGAALLLIGVVGYGIHVIRAPSPLVAAPPSVSLDSLLAALPPQSDSRIPRVAENSRNFGAAWKQPVRATRHIVGPGYPREEAATLFNFAEAPMDETRNHSTAFESTARLSASANQAASDGELSREEFEALTRVNAMKSPEQRTQGTSLLSSQVDLTWFDGTLDIPVTSVEERKYKLGELNYVMGRGGLLTLGPGVGYNDTSGKAFMRFGYPTLSYERLSSVRNARSGALQSIRDSNGPPYNSTLFPDSETTWLQDSFGLYSANSPASQVKPLATIVATGASRPTIFGSVVSPNGSAVAQAKVLATGPGTQAPLVALSDKEGKFTFHSLPEGTYSLTVESKGFEPVTVEGANVRAQYPLQLDFRLNETARARESPAMTAGSSAPIPNFFSNESTYDDASNSQRSVLRSRRARRRASAQPGMSFHQRGLMSDRSQTQKLDYVIEKGQIIRVSLAGQLSSADAKVGDHFETSVVSPVYSGWNKAIPVGSFITGRVEDVKRAAITDGPGVLDVRFVSLRLPDGSRHEIEGRLADLPGDAARPPVSTVLSEYDFKRKVVFRGGDAVQPGTRITALLQSQGDSANLHSSMGLHTFTLPAANKREEAAVRRNEEFWVILKKSVKLPTSGNN